MSSVPMIFIFVVGSIFSMLLLGFMFWSMRNLSKGQLNQDQYFKDFLEQTNYRFADMPDAPIDEQVQALMAQYADTTLWQQGFQTNYLRREYGMEVLLQIYYKNATSGSCWRVLLDKAPTVNYHILRKVKCTPLFAQQIKIGDPLWDKKYKVYGEDPEAVRQLLLDSGLREMLETCITVDLRVLPQEVVFSDPTNKNVNSAMGGLMGQALTGADPNKNQSMVTPVYNHITDLVLLAASKSQPV